MEKLTRRLFLRNTAAAGAVGATITAPIFAEAAQEESPELLRIIEEMKATEAAIYQGIQEKEAARARYEAIAPVVPDEMVVTKFNNSLRHVADSERDCFMEFVGTSEFVSARLVVTSYQFERHYERLLVPAQGRASGSQKWAREFLERVKAHEAAVQLAKDEAGCDEAFYALQDKFSRMDKLASQLTKHPARTGAGLAAKAMAFERHKRCSTIERPHSYYSELDAARSLKADIIALFGGETIA